MTTNERVHAQAVSVIESDFANESETLDEYRMRLSDQEPIVLAPLAEGARDPIPHPQTGDRR